MQLADVPSFQLLVASKNVSLGERSWTVSTNLETCSDYFYRVRTNGETGSGPWSNVGSFRVIEGGGC